MQSVTKTRLGSWMQSRDLMQSVTKTRLGEVLFIVPITAELQMSPNPTILKLLNVY